MTHLLLPSPFSRRSQTGRNADRTVTNPSAKVSEYCLRNSLCDPRAGRPIRPARNFWRRITVPAPGKANHFPCFSTREAHHAR